MSTYHFQMNPGDAPIINFHYECKNPGCEDVLIDHTLEAAGDAIRLHQDDGGSALSLRSFCLEIALPGDEALPELTLTSTLPFPAGTAISLKSAE